MGWRDGLFSSLWRGPWCLLLVCLLGTVRLDATAPGFIAAPLRSPCCSIGRRGGHTVVMGLWDAFKSPSQAAPAAPTTAAPGKKPSATTKPAGPPKPVTVTFLPSKITVSAQPGQNLKTVAKAAKVTDIRFGCNSGDCAMCMGKINGVKGKVCRAVVPATGGRMTIEAIPRETTTPPTTTKKK